VSRKAAGITEQIRITGFEGTGEGASGAAGPDRFHKLALWFVAPASWPKWKWLPPSPRGRPVRAGKARSRPAAGLRAGVPGDQLRGVGQMIARKALA